MSTYHTEQSFSAISLNMVCELIKNIMNQTKSVPDGPPQIIYYEEPPLTIPPFPSDPAAALPPGVVVRTEEALIVIFVLVLWIAAIALFFNRWGKIRMLEPYQPKFHQEHRTSCAMVDSIGHSQSQHRTSFSKFNMLEPPIFASVPPTYRTLVRPRQNSVFVGSFNTLTGQNPPRKTKSAIDIQSLIQNDSSSTSNIGQNKPIQSIDRRTSVSGFLRRPSCSTGLLLSPRPSCDRRNSVYSDFVPLRERHYYNDFLTPSLHQANRRPSCSGDYLSVSSSSRDRRPSFNNVIAQVTAERRPSSSMLRISNV
ncbi:uncharacterized protein LOC142333864 [Lycorma delicatula]|uniref:uncharacterized protein LOC142333864 n=1 Tax=Lycorma delicatula TaxID=130591 RepID=UPI003F51A557